VEWQREKFASDIVINPDEPLQYLYILGPILIFLHLKETVRRELVMLQYYSVFD